MADGEYTGSDNRDRARKYSGAGADPKLGRKYSGSSKANQSGEYTGDREGKKDPYGKDEIFVPKGMKDETTRNRLFNSVQKSYEGLQPFRSLMHNLVEEYTGSAYGHGMNPKHEIYMNLMNQAVEAYTMALSANRPRVIIGTPHEQLNYFAKIFETAANNLIKEVELEKTIRRWVLDAFFCVGIVKVHMADAGFVEVEQDIWADPGKPFASNVSLDNFVFDMNAHKYSEIQYAGDSYRIPFSTLKDESLWDQDVVRELNPTSKFHQDKDRLDLISRGMTTDPDEYEPMIDLMDLWLPRDNMIYTFAMDHAKRFEGRYAPLAEMSWDGPEFGPYHLLSFNDVPENIMPTSPASHLNNLSKLANNIMRKNAASARAARRVHTYPPASHKDAQRVQRAGADAWVQVQENGELREVQIGGVDEQNAQFLQGIVQMFDRMSGNLQLQAGLGATAPTARQEQIVKSQASKMESQMQYRVVEAATKLIRDLAFMLWQDEAMEIPAKYEIEGTDINVDATWTPTEREGDFVDYNLDIDIFSMGYQSPDDRVKNVTGMLNLFAQFQEQLMQSGGQIDFAALLDLMSELTNEPRLKKFIKFEENESMIGDIGPQGEPTNATKKVMNNDQAITEGARNAPPRQQPQQPMMGQPETGGGLPQMDAAPMGGGPPPM